MNKLSKYLLTSDLCLDLLTKIINLVGFQTQFWGDQYVYMNFVYLFTESPSRSFSLKPSGRLKCSSLAFPIMFS